MFGFDSITSVNKSNSHFDLETASWGHYKVEVYFLSVECILLTAKKVPQFKTPFVSTMDHSVILG